MESLVNKLENRLCTSLEAIREKEEGMEKGSSYKLQHFEDLLLKEYKK